MSKNPPQVPTSKIGVHSYSYDPYTTFFGTDEPPEATDFYIAIGRVVALWGRVEYCLQQIKIRIDRPEITGLEAEKERVSLDQRVKHLRRLYETAPDLAGLKVTGQELLTQANAASKKRNKILHAAFWCFAPDPPFRALFYSVVRDDRPKSIEEITPHVRLTSIVDLVGEIGVLNFNLFHHLIEMDRHLEAIGKAPGQGAMRLVHPPQTKK